MEITAPTCRICQISGNSSDKDVVELLVSPCECRGSLGLVHKFCMEKWLNMRNQDTCELCHFKFVTKKRFKPFNEVGYCFNFALLEFYYYHQFFMTDRKILTRFSDFDIRQISKK